MPNQRKYERVVRVFVKLSIQHKRARFTHEKARNQQCVSHGLPIKATSAAIPRMRRRTRSDEKAHQRRTGRNSSQRGRRGKSEKLD